MVDVLARNWWAIAIRGIAAILFGLCAFFIPGAALWALVILFGAYCLVDGVFAIVAALRAAQAHERWAQLLFAGIFGVLIAGITLFEPGLTALALVYVIAAWAVVTGAFELLAAFELRRHLPGEFWWLLAGLCSVVFGVFLFWQPGTGALAVLWLIGGYAVAFGVFLLGLALRLRRHLRGEHTAVAA
ncbi:MAG TPA: HdeD family acid-resistance protein [Candidatus Baltobacteraceae bacterium]|nr:HdeD family acid-resistance protein [Candidatus Baltobacteraceae bacterium]